MGKDTALTLFNSAFHRPLLQNSFFLKLWNIYYHLEQSVLGNLGIEQDSLSGIPILLFFHIYSYISIISVSLFLIN